MSDRDQAAEKRDREAEGRDSAAQARDDLIVDGDGVPSIQRSLAALDRANAARDRGHAARDRQSARDELASEGIDSLTGAMGRRVGLAAVRREMDRAERTGGNLVLAFVDTVGLKAINDTRGHAAGDQVLEEIASCINQGKRSYDLVARVGGDEFICTHSGQSIAQAETRYASLALRLAEKSGNARMSVGLASLGAGDSVADLVDRADRAMIAARR